MQHRAGSIRGQNCNKRSASLLRTVKLFKVLLLLKLALKTNKPNLRNVTARDN